MRIALRIFTATVLSASAGGFAAVNAQSGEATQGTPGWIFTPSVSFGGLWNDNLLLAHEDDKPPRDYGTPISPSATLDFNGRRTKFSSSYGGSLIFYRTLEELNDTHQQLSTMFQHRPTARVSLYVQENFTLAPTTDSLELAGVPFYRIGSRTNVLAGGVDAALLRHTSLTGSYSLSSVSFDEDDRAAVGLQGGYAHEFAVALGQSISRRLKLGAQYQLRRAVLSEGTDRFGIQTGSLTADYELSPTTKLTGLVGIALLGAGLHHEAQTGPAVRAGITHEARRATMSAVFQRTFIPSWGFGGTYQNQEWIGAVQVPFARNRAYVSGSVTRFDAESLDALQPSLKSWFVSSTVGYRATRWLNLEGYYGRAQQDSQLAGGKRRRNEIGFRIVATKPLKLQ